MTSLQQLLLKTSTDGRICPQPVQWDALWKLLPNRQRVGNGWQPSLPLILGAWWQSSDSEKRERFELHLRWADQYGALEDVTVYLKTLEPGDWHMASTHG